MYNLNKTIAEQLNIKEFPFEIKDKNGNIIYSEDSDGYWHKYEIDSNGNKIYYEDLDGYWYKRKFDLNGNIIYSEDSDGYWKKYEYDLSKKLIYHEDSENGILINKRNPYKNKIIEIDGKKYQLKEV